MTDQPHPAEHGPSPDPELATVSIDLSQGTVKVDGVSRANTRVAYEKTANDLGKVTIEMLAVLGSIDGPAETGYVVELIDSIEHARQWPKGTGATVPAALRSLADEVERQEGVRARDREHLAGHPMEHVGTLHMKAPHRLVPREDVEDGFVDPADPDVTIMDAGTATARFADAVEAAIKREGS